MAANGGEDRLRQIAEQRLASAGPQQQAQARPQQPAQPVQPGVQLAAAGPTSDVGPTPNEMAVQMLGRQPGPTTPVAPGQTTQNAAAMPGTTMQQVEQAGPPTSAMGPDAWVTRFATAQQDPKMVAEIAYDPNAPKWVRGMAEQNLGTQIQNKREAATAQQLVNTSIQNGDMKPLAGAMTQQDGSWVKYYLFNRLGLVSAAQNEAIKLGLMNKTVVASGPEGEHGLLTLNGRGEPVGGVKSDGTKLTSEEALQWASLGEKNASMLKTAQTQAVQTYASTKNYLEKQAYETRRVMGPGYDLSQDGLSPSQIEATSRARANDVMNQARATRTAIATNAPLAIPQGGVAQTSVGPTGKTVQTGAEPTGGGAGNEQRVKSMAEKIANYEMAPPSSKSGPYGVLMREVSRVNPNYDENIFKQAKATRTEFTKLSPQSGGGQLQAVNRAIPHLSQYEEAVRALNNGNMPMVNGILQDFGYNVGDDKVAAARAIQGLVSTEIQKAVAGGLGGVDERKDLKDMLGTTLNNQQLARVIHEYQGLMAAQATGLKQNWTSSGLSEKEFESKLVPKTREVLKRHQREENNTRSNW
jgi:hypothetical protein